MASIDEFRARALIAKMDLAPQLNATVSTPAFGRKANISFPGFPNPFSYYTQGNLFWEIDVWGRIRRSNEAAREQREAQAQQVEALRSALRLANLRYKGGLANYLDVLIAQRNLFEADCRSPRSIGCIWYRSSNSTKHWEAGGRMKATRTKGLARGEST